MARYKLGAEGMPTLVCESGFTADPDWTPFVQSSVLTQTLVQKIIPTITGDDADIYNCIGGFKKLYFDDISSCLGNNARNPRQANVNGLISFVCNKQARIRRISIRAKVEYTKKC